jgi:hypothetical protein
VAVGPPVAALVDVDPAVAEPVVELAAAELCDGVAVITELGEAELDPLEPCCGSTAPVPTWLPPSLPGAADICADAGAATSTRIVARRNRFMRRQRAAAP